MNEVSPTFLPSSESINKPTEAIVLNKLEENRHYIISIAHQINSHLSDTDAKEIAQAVIHKAVIAIKGKNGFKGESDIKTWLFKITRNLIFDESRSKKRKHDKGLVDEIPGYFEAQHPGKNPEEEYLQKEKNDKLYTAIEALPTEHREVIKLRLGGMEVKEIAKILGIKLNAAKQRLKRATEDIRSIIKN